MTHLAYPRNGFISQKERIERVLLLCFFERNGVPSIVETIEYIQRLSKFPVTVLNLYEHRLNNQFLSLPSEYNLSAFSCIIIHNTISYNPDNLFSLDSQLSLKLSNYKGVKILFKQDDHYRFKEVSKFISNAKIDVIFTLTPMDEVNKVYQFSGTQNIKILPMLAGYVTPNMRNLHFSENRSIDIGYRGSIMPLSFGKLCFEKRKIGDDVLALLNTRKDLKLNISSKHEDRIGGAGWYEFLRDCKAVLGVESGSGIFDLNGDLQKKCREIENKIGPFKLDHAYAELYLNELSDFEGNVKYYSVSPRHFEAISNGAIQILFPGKYTNKMVADRHYLTLRRDYKNLNEIVEKILDPQFRKKFAQRAFEEVILDKSNWIETFVAQVDEVINEKILNNNSHLNQPIHKTPKSSSKNLLLIQASEHGSDPRRDVWIPEGASPNLSFHQLTIDKMLKAPSLRLSSRGNAIYSLPYKTWTQSSFSEYSILLGQMDPISSILSQIQFALSLKSDLFAEYFGAPLHSKRLNEFRWSLNSLLNTTCTLLNGLKFIRGYQTLVAVNLPTLISAIIVKKLHGIPVAYEALEYWPEMEPESEQFEIDFWTSLEKLLLKEVDYANTVSPGISNAMLQAYDVVFDVLPNACPLKMKAHPSKLEPSNNNIQFLYQGSFAKFRGLEELIMVFASSEVNAKLLLRGHNSEHKVYLKALAKKLGLLNNKVFFLDPVPTEDLISAAASTGSVGVIPYMPVGLNYQNCSPNKLGQYFAAGLPILANRTNFIEEQIKKSGAGIVVDFTNKQELLKAIQLLSNNQELLVKFSMASNTYFLNYFNWENLSKTFYKNLDQISDKVNSTEFYIHKIDNEKLFNIKINVFHPRYLKLVIYKFGWKFGIYLWATLPESFKLHLKPFLRFLFTKLVS